MKPIDLYQKKKTTVPKALSLINNGEKIALSMGVSQPYNLMYGLAESIRVKKYSKLKLYYMHANEAATETLLQEDLMDVLEANTFFISHHDRELFLKRVEQNKDYINFIPSTFSQVGKLITEEIGARVFLATASPMNEDGYFSLGTNADYGACCAKKCDIVILEINKNMPFVHGDHLVHISKVAALVEHNHALMSHPVRESSEKDKNIAGMILNHINDGDTIQLGVGGVPAAVAEYLKDKNDLGLHSELFSDATAFLIKNGNITGRQKTLLPHKHIFTLALGSEETYQYMQENENIHGFPAAFVNCPSVISKNRNMKSINAAVEVDLFGQINAEVIKGVQWSGSGGQLDFVRGAYQSFGGASFIALYSTTKNDTISKIVPVLKSPSTDPRVDANWVVTEQGIVNLKGKSLKDRALALISIAHPNFRDSLMEEAKQLNLII